MRRKRRVPSENFHGKPIAFSRWVHEQQSIHSAMERKAITEHTSFELAGSNSLFEEMLSHSSTRRLSHLLTKKSRCRFDLRGQKSRCTHGILAHFSKMKTSSILDQLQGAVLCMSDVRSLSTANNETRSTCYLSSYSQIHFAKKYRVLNHPVEATTHAANYTT